MTRTADVAEGGTARRWAGRLRAALSPSFLLGAAWAAVAVAQVRRRLRAGALAVAVVRPPIVNRGAGRGVRAVLGRLQPTCLERSLVLQRWLASTGVRRDVLVGVRRTPEGGFSAHAWLDGEPGGDQGHLELHRLPPPA